MKRRPHVYVIAGCNGSGKTTFAQEFLPAATSCKHFVNADLIAAGISPFAPEKAAMQAGRIVLAQLRALSAAKKDFAFESTLAGKAYAPFLRELKKQGYVIHIFYLWIPLLGLALARIEERVKQGGHHIATKDVRRRYGKSIKNFISEYRALSDYWDLVDNAGASPRWIAIGNRDKIHVIHEKPYAAFLKPEPI